MVWMAASFLAGTGVLFLAPQLPPAAMLAMGIPSLLNCRRHGNPVWWCVFLAGFSCAWLGAEARLAGRLPERLSHDDFEVTVRVSSLPAVQGNRVRFLALTDAETRPEGVPHKILLSWYYPPQIPALGDIWRFRVRLKPPRGFQNPGGFDYERWLFARNIGATGYVRKSAATRLLSGGSGFKRMRQRLADHLAGNFPATDGAVLAALATGFRAGVPDSAWETLERTGTRHLLAISGMHVGMAAMLGMLAAQLLWRLGWCGVRLLPRGVLVCSCALVPAVWYAALAGFSIPTQRALCALLGVALAAILRVKLSGLQILSCALVAVLVFDPVAVLEVSFWLSFVVSFFLVVLASSSTTRSWRNLVAIQLLLFPLLVPLTSAYFNQVSWVTPVANLVVIPLFTFLVVPGLLAGVVLFATHAAGATVLFELVARILRGIFAFLERLAALDGVYMDIYPGKAAIAIAGLFVVVWLLPRYVPGRIVALALLLPLFGPYSHREKSAALTVHVLDVGQGLAIVVATDQHVMLYDTGARFGSGSSAAELVVVPFLESHYGDLDKVVISHADQDHAGGLAVVLERFPGAELHASPDGVLGVTGRMPCARGLKWIWDGVRFEVLHPQVTQTGNRNNRSCVLKISVGEYGVLLTGDIERFAEFQIVHQQENELPSTVLLVPHHGSRSSSSIGLLCAVRPTLALISAGHGNQWGLPAEEILARYRAHGIPVMNTADSGAIQLQLDEKSGLVSVSSHRAGARALWRSSTGLIASPRKIQYDSLMLQGKNVKKGEVGNPCWN